MKRFLQAFALVALVGSFAHAANEIRIKIYTGSFDGSGQITGTETLHTNTTRNAGAELKFDGTDLPLITDSGSFTRINVYAESNPETHNIGRITINGPAMGSWTNNVHLIIGTQTSATVNEPPGVFAQDCEGITAARPIRLQMSIARNLVANVLVTDIRRIDIGGSHKFGDIQASVWGPRRIIIAGDMETQSQFSPRIRALGAMGIEVLEVGGDLTGEVWAEVSGAPTSYINQIRVLGNMTGSIHTDGPINEFIRVDGNLGEVSANASISAGDKIQEITVDGDAWASISVNGGVEVSSASPPVTHTLPRLEVFNVGGDLHGTFNGPSIADLNVGGDLYADRRSA